MTEPRDPAVVDLVDAGVPADQGLSALGMLMQLAGNVLAAYVALIMFMIVFASRGAGGSETLWFFLVLGLSIGRSLLHRSAGATLLYGDPDVAGGRMRGVQRYIAFGLGQSLVMGAVFKFKFEMDNKIALGITLGLSLWPALLAGMLALPRFRRFKDELPLTEDKGFEGASILMTVLGLCGLIGTATLLVVLLQLPSRALQQGTMVIVVLALALLVVRSIIHVQAGVSGLRTTSVDRSVELANRYANFGVISAFCGGGAMLLFVMSTAMSVGGLAIVCGICWMLIAWPMIIRRFFSDRQFADLLAGDHAPVHRRAPDAGLTWLGWLLIAQGALSFSLLLPQIIMGVTGGGEGSGGASGMQLSNMFSLLASAGYRSVWWTVGLLLFQGWAGFELVRMSAQSRIIATVYGVAGIGITVYTNLPLFEALRHGMGRQLGTDAVAFGPLALALVIPVATLLLVNRKIAPVATARFRSKT